MILSFTLPAFLVGDMAKGIAIGFVLVFLIPVTGSYIWHKIQSRREHKEYMLGRYGKNWRDKEHRLKVEAEERKKNKADFEEFDRKFYG